MKAVLLKTAGDPDQLEYADLPIPEPAQGELLVRVKNCSVNHLDLWIRGGLTAYGTTLPHILGADISGVVASSGGAVFAQEDEVIVSPGVSCFACPACLAGDDNLCSSYTIMGAGRDGGYAEYVAVRERDLIAKPASISFEEAAAFPLTFLTAWHMLFYRAGLKPGELLVVLGAGSGVGSAAVQIGRLAGARVVAVAGADYKLQKSDEMGADYLVNYSTEDFSAAVREISGGSGADVVFDHIGPATWNKSIRSLKKGGRLVTCGASSGPNVDLDLRYLFSRQLSLFGSIMGRRHELLEVTRLIGAGRLKPVVDAVFPLSEAVAAHKKMESRQLCGKLLLSC